MRLLHNSKTSPKKEQQHLETAKTAYNYCHKCTLILSRSWPELKKDRLPPCKIFVLLKPYNFSYATKVSMLFTSFTAITDAIIVIAQR